MKKGSVILTVIIIILIIVSAIVMWGVGIYNKAVSLETKVDTAWAEVENQLQRRYDLVPDLVNVANKYAENEKEIINSVVNARASMAGATTSDDKIEASKELESAISRLLVVVENYPELKSNEQYIRVMDEMAGTENRIAVARRDYNEAVETYNIKIKTFPTLLFKGMLGAEERELFEVQEEAKVKPDYNL